MAKPAVKVKLKTPLSASQLSQVYKTLLKKHQHQGWWPGDTPFEVSVGAILTQNTSWANVEKAIINLKKAKVLNVRSMLKLSQKQLASLIRPAGYFNLKAKRLSNFVSYLWKEYKGDFRKMRSRPLNDLRVELLKVNGVGPETADSILLYAVEMPTFVIDAYTRRIFERHRIHLPGKRYQASLVEDYHLLKELFEAHLNAELDLYQDFHAQIVLTAKNYCHSGKALCDSCPLSIYL